MYGLIYKNMSLEERKTAYKSDIIYGSLNEFTTDYLRDNSAENKNILVQNNFKYALINNPYILKNNLDTEISISKKTLNNEYSYLKANAFARRLKDDIKEPDFIIENNKKSIKLTNKGISKLEENYEIKNYNEDLYPKLAFFINNALVAQHIVKRDIDYIIENNRIKMLNKIYDIPIQSLEAKEHLKITSENNIIAKISYRNYLTMYKKVHAITNNKVDKAIKINGNAILSKKINIVYKKRKHILLLENVNGDIQKLIDSLCHDITKQYYDRQKLSNTKLALLKRFKMLENKELNMIEFEKRLQNLIHSQYAKTEEIVGSRLRILEKELLLKQIDEKWIVYQEKIENIKIKKYELDNYKIEVDKIFNEFIDNIKENITKDLLFAKKQDNTK